jgi:hypothetical protein
LVEDQGGVGQVGFFGMATPWNKGDSP